MCLQEILQRHESKWPGEKIQLWTVRVSLVWSMCAYTPFFHWHQLFCVQVVHALVALVHYHKLSSYLWGICMHSGKMAIIVALWSDWQTKKRENTRYGLWLLWSMLGFLSEHLYHAAASRSRLSKHKVTGSSSWLFWICLFNDCVLTLPRQEGSGSGTFLPQRADQQHEGREPKQLLYSYLVPRWGWVMWLNHTSVKSSSIAFCLCAMCQPKQLRRLIQQTFQGYSTLKQDQCVNRFFTTLAQCYSYTQETYACQLVVSLSAPVINVLLCNISS